MEVKHKKTQKHVVYFTKANCQSSTDHTMETAKSHLGQPNETKIPFYHKLSMDMEGIVLLSMRYSCDVSLAYRESPVDITAKPLD